MKDKDKEKFNKYFFFQNYLAEDDWKNIMNKENMNFNSILHSFLNKFTNKNAPLNKQQNKIFYRKKPILKLFPEKFQWGTLYRICSSRKNSISQPLTTSNHNPNT